jgi:hypothetical protein
LRLSNVTGPLAERLSQNLRTASSKTASSILQEHLGEEEPTATEEVMTEEAITGVAVAGRSSQLDLAATSATAIKLSR